MKTINLLAVSALLISVIIFSACGKTESNTEATTTVSATTAEVTTEAQTTVEPTTEEVITYGGLEEHNYHIGEDENGMPIIVDDIY